jgi:hypothetical protein
MTGKNLLVKYPYEWLSALLLFVYFFHVIFMPNKTLFLIHDNLDGTIPLLVFLGSSDTYFASGQTIVEGVMGGIPRATLPSAWSFLSLCFYFFPPLLAYIVHYIAQHLIAFFGMRFFIQSFISQEKKIVYGVALAFASLPFFPGASMTVAGLPFLTWALVCIFKKQSSVVHWLIIIVFPFFSSLPVGNLFSFPIFFTLALCAVFYKHWKFSFDIFSPFIVLAIFTIIAEYQLLELILSGFDSNRSAEITQSKLNFKGVLGTTLLSLLFGHYHFHSLHFLIFISVLGVGIYLTFKKRFKELISVSMIPFLIIVLCFITIYIPSSGILSGTRINIRFWAIYPFLWYGLFAMVLTIIKNNTIRTFLILVQVVWTMFLVFPNDYYGSNDAENVFAQTFLKGNHDEYATFNNYYKIDDFKQLSNKFPEIKENNIVCLGFVPGIALFNGYKTFDAYLNIYPKEKFETWNLINEKEFLLSNSPKLFSNKAYLFSRELETKNKITSEPNWNKDQFEKANVKYIISTLNKLPGYQNVANCGSLYVYKI